MTNDKKRAQIWAKIWALNESIFYLEEAYHRAKDPDYKKGTRDQITQLEQEKQEYYKMWEDLNK